MVWAELGTYSVNRVKPSYFNHRAAGGNNTPDWRALCPNGLQSENPGHARDFIFDGRTEMCQRCDQSNARLIEHRERIDALISDAIECLKGNYRGNTREMMKEDPFPEDKPFMEILFRTASAASMLATASALISGDVPSITMGEWAGVALESELESGIINGAAQIIGSMLADLPDENGEKPVMH